MSTLTPFNSALPTKPLKHVAALRGEKADSVPADAEYIGLEQIESGTGRLSAVAPEQQPAGSANVFTEGDVLFGKLRPYLAKGWTADRAGYCTTEALVLQPKRAESRFVRYCLLTPEFIEAVNGSTYGSKMPRADWSFVGSVQVPCPSLPAQERIANFLDEQTARIDALIAEKERLASAVEELTLSRLVSASLADNPVSGTYWEAVSKAQVPDDWQLIPLRALFEESKLKNDESARENYLSLVSGVGVIPYAEKGDLGNKKPDDLSKCKVVQAGDFVLNCMNFGIGAFGVSPQSGVCSPVYIVLRARVTGGQFEFLRLLFSSQYFQKSIQSLGRGIMELRYAFGWDDIKNLKVPMPNDNVASEVCCTLTKIQASGKALRKHVDEHITRLREYRYSLISAAVTGQLDVSSHSFENSTGFV